ncbi:hypothetical protein F5B19DRAFT_493498 [Rostrohypoxylon terebratum]|nr:hypothetical protein F5B19DRAFT_493498 [Rostrohypoxylon terebratum]
MTPISGEKATETDDQWIRVRRKGRRAKSYQPIVLESSNTNTHNSTSRPSFLSISQVITEHRRIRDQWRASAGCHQLRHAVASRNCGSAITHAICFGLGSFDPEDGSWENRRRAHVQLAAFLYMVEQLQRGDQEPIRCLFQEPLFNSVDEEFIRSLGHGVVYSPRGFDEVGPSTMVFGIHLYKNIYSQALANHLPAVFVGTPREVWEDCCGPDISDWVRLQELDEQCDKVKFPEDSGHMTFSSTAIHWKRQHET